MNARTSLGSGWDSQNSQDALRRLNAHNAASMKSLCKMIRNGNSSTQTFVAVVFLRVVVSITNVDGGFIGQHAIKEVRVLTNLSFFSWWPLIVVRPVSPRFSNPELRLSQTQLGSTFSKFATLVPWDLSWSALKRCDQCYQRRSAEHPQGNTAVHCTETWSKNIGSLCFPQVGTYDFREFASGRTIDCKPVVHLGHSPWCTTKSKWIKNTKN